MAYNPYNAVNTIYNLKGQWDEANKSGDTLKKNETAQKAKDYYNELKKYGYTDAADALSSSNFEQSKAIKDYYAKTGRTGTNDYMYSLGKAYGLSGSDIDNLVKYDSTTGEVSFGGKNIGKPDAVSSDGFTYWNDTSKLDSAFNDYTKRSGTTPSYSSLGLQNSTGVKNKTDELWGLQTSDHSAMNDLYKKEYNYLKNTNPFETEEGQAILAKYDLAALQGRDNQTASGAATNGGNIDSFAAANALRQQAALTAQGQEVALSAHQQKLDHAKSLLESLGVYQQNSYAGMQNTIGIQQNEAQRLFDNVEAEKNNKVSRDVAISKVTGVVPSSTLYQTPYYSTFFNTDGTLKNPDIDYKAEIEKAEDANNPELAKVLRAARGVKIFSDYSKYGKYADGDYTLPGAKTTESARQFNEQLSATERINNADNTSAERINAANNASNEKITGSDLTANMGEVYGVLLQLKEDKLDKSQALARIADYYGYGSDAYKYASANIDSIYEGGNIFA